MGVEEEAAVRAVVQGGDPAPRLVLTDRPAVRRRITWPKPLAAYAEEFGVSVQTVKHWISCGKKKDDVPPLDRRWELAAWWSRVMTIRVPDNLRAFACERPADPESPASAGNDVPPPVAPGGGIDPAGFEVRPGDALVQARQYLAATHEKLSRAYQAGKDDEIRLWQPRWEKAAEAVRKAEKDDREARRQSGDLVSQGDVVADVMTFLETLRTMRDSLVRRVTEGLPLEFGDEQRAAVAAVIEREMARDIRVLGQIEVVRSQQDLVERMEAARAA